MARDTDRGSLVFEVKPGFENLKAGAIMLIAGVALYGFFHFGRAHLWGIFCLLASAYFLCYGALNWFTVFRCFQRGIEFNGRFIAFEDLTSISARIYTVKQTKTTKLCLDGINADGPLTIRVTISEFAGKSANGDHVVEKVSAAIVDQLKESLRTTGSTPCGNLATLAADSMLLHSGGREVAYRDIVAVRLTAAFFRGDLLIRTADGFKTSIKLTEPNAYPLYYLLRSLVVAEANVQTNVPSAYEQRSSRGCFFILSAGLFVLAAPLLALLVIIRAPVPHAVLVAVVAMFLASGVFLWLGLRAKQ
jgi:hypothetical protein